MKKLLLLLPVLILLSWCWIISEDWEHTWQVTAIERSWIFRKTTDVYFKTDISSSQEDIYCVENDDVEKLLREYSKSKSNVTIKYHQERITAPTRCSQYVIIDDVELNTWEIKI